jgi:hypothetical protein
MIPQHNNSFAQSLDKISLEEQPLYVAEKKLVEVIEKCFAQAQKVDKVQRKEILTSLLSDLSQQIDAELKQSLLWYYEQPAGSALIRQTEAAPIQVTTETVANESSNKTSFLYYYELLADFFHRNPESATKILDASSQHLITNAHFPSIFALLFHRWLFSSCHLTLSRYNLFLKGVNRLFMSNLSAKQVCYRRVYKYLKYDVLLNKNADKIFQHALQHSKMTTPIHSPPSSPQPVSDDVEWITSKKLDLISLIAKYFFHYELQSGKKHIDTYLQLLAQTHGALNVQSFTERITDIFVHENILLLSVIRDEQMLISHINDFQYFLGLDISRKMRHKLQAALYALSTTASRPVRHKAREVLDILFPHGRYARSFLNASMRVFHQPLLWPSSIYHWCTGKLWSIVQLPVSVFQWVRSIFPTVAPTDTPHEESELDKLKHQS